MSVISTYINPFKKVRFYWLLMLGVICLFLMVSLDKFYYNNERNFSRRIHSHHEIEEILRQQRIEIEKEMKGYPYDVLSGRNFRTLSDLAMERGGKPVRSVIFSTYRSGSSFLGDLVSAHPASYYTYEPLIGLNQIRLPLTSQLDRKIVESVLKCNFSHLGAYLDYRVVATWYFNDHNRYLKKRCGKDENLCRDPEFFTRFCRLFPFQVMKVLRLNLSSMDDFLKDQKLGVKVVLLVRDPRGILNSRKELDWCKDSLSCNNANSLCSNLVSDYESAINFSKRYPKTFKYEDLTSNLWKLSKEIYSFYGIHFHENVKKFIHTHTRMNVSHDSDPYSSFRNSKTVAFKWKEELSFDEVKKIQESCREAMYYWGYNLAMNMSHQMTFNPVKPLSTSGINYFHSFLYDK